MSANSSARSKKEKAQRSARATHSSAKKAPKYKNFKQSYLDSRARVWQKKNERLKLHHSFRRSYREDYKREFKAPGFVQHAMMTLKIICRNWRLFLPLIFTIMAINIFVIGLMSEQNYVAFQDVISETYENITQENIMGRLAKSAMVLLATFDSAGLNASTDGASVFITITLALIVWLVTIYFLRKLLAGQKPRFRDGMYNAMAPIISTFVTLALVFLHSIPFLIFIVTYSVAVQTGFLSTPLYCFVYWVFAVLLITLSFYLLCGSVLALVATAVPGIYPLAAINATTDLVQGRRMQLVFRFIFLAIFLAVCWIVVMLPITYLDMFIKESFFANSIIPVVPFCIQFMTVFSMIYTTAYIYLFYRRMLDDPN